MIYKTNYIELMKGACKANRWTYAAISRELKLSRAAVAAVFAGKIKGPESIKRICDIIGMKFKDLIAD